MDPSNVGGEDLDKNGEREDLADHGVHSCLRLSGDARKTDTSRFYAGWRAVKCFLFKWLPHNLKKVDDLLRESPVVPCVMWAKVHRGLGSEFVAN